MTVSAYLALRLALGVVAVLIVLQLFMAASSALVGGRDFEHAARPMLVNQIRSAVELLDRLEPRDRGKAVGALDSPFLRFTLLEQYPEDPLSTPPLPEFRTAIAAFGSILPTKRKFQIYRRSPRSPLERAFQYAGRLRTVIDAYIVVVALEDGSALAVEPSSTYRRLMVQSFVAVIVGFWCAVCLGLLIWAAVATARSLSQMSDAAQRFSRDLSAPPLETRGPKSVRHLAESFNVMQDRIRRLVHERSETLAAVAHDFRTYLTRLRLRAEFIQDEGQREKAIHDLDEMANLVNDALLAVRAETRGGTGQDLREAVDPVDLARELVAGHADLGNPVRFHARPGLERFAVLAERTALKRALANLLDNAMRYGGDTVLTVDRVADDMLFTVRDTGKGVPEDVLSRLTDPFFRVEGSRSRDTGGAGLGLAIVQRLVEGAGGRLTLRNHPEGGFEATVTLPVAS
ncbi:MAG: sensor histidine kinase [Alphaproteobacteria bacterium]